MGQFPSESDKIILNQLSVLLPPTAYQGQRGLSYAGYATAASQLIKTMNCHTGWPNKFSLFGKIGIVKRLALQRLRDFSRIFARCKFSGFVAWASTSVLDVETTNIYFKFWFISSNLVHYNPVAYNFKPFRKSFRPRNLECQMPPIFLGHTLVWSWLWSIHIVWCHYLGKYT